MTPHSTSASPPPPLIPYHCDPLAELAAKVIRDQQGCLPDLNQVTVLLPDNAAARYLRRQLLSAAQAAGHPALLGPHILTLGEWIRQFLPEEIQLCDDQSRELQLVEALLEQTDLLGGANAWSLTESLSQLFDELTLNQIQLPDTLQDFSQQLAAAYHISDTSLPPFSHEAKIVYSLWRGWKQQLQDQQQIDSSMAYVLALNHALQHLDGQIIYLAGYAFLSRAEQDWQTKAKQLSNITIMGQIRSAAEHTTQTGSSYSQCLDAIFDTKDQSLRQRAQQFAAAIPQSPLQKTLTVYSAQSHEEEAHAIDVQIRQWLLQGKQRIGVVTENRRLARRLRALLERADVPLEDASGWALSTTSAAATLEALLQCLEEDFSHSPFLDLLKSPFIFHDLDTSDVEMSVFRLEQDIILHENIARGLTRYRRHLLRRQARLPDWMPEVSPTLLTVLDRFDQVAAPFKELRNGRHLAHKYISILSEALALLGITPALQADAAGQRILQIIDTLTRSAAPLELQLNWLDFRSWLGRQLEQTYFKPTDCSSPVQLMGLAQSNLQSFDGLIIASAEQEFLPGQSRVSPFFNQAVRHELGLTTSRELRQLRFEYFRRLLESADQILISLRHEQNGEPVSASPWLAQLQSFHTLAWGQELDAAELKQITASPHSQVIRCDDKSLPDIAQQPRPSIAEAHVPSTITASDYQLLMDCPYHFYAARCLKLSAPENIRDALAKADYGQRVHLCLQAFHSDVENMPGPFKDRLTKNNRAQAVQLLNEISNSLFKQDLEENFAHRAWLQLWQSVIPHYVDWQIKRTIEWQVKETEASCDIELTPKLNIKGRLDRIDQADDKLAIIDYKTGAVPSIKDVMHGEAVQLPFYAMLSKAMTKPVSRVEYLKLDKPDNVNSAVILEGEELDAMLTLIEQRLQTIMQQIQNGEGMPAWPDDKKCGRCDMQTLCRRQVWQDN